MRTRWATPSEDTWVILNLVKLFHNGRTKKHTKTNKRQPFCAIINLLSSQHTHCGKSYFERLQQEKKGLQYRRMTYRFAVNVFMTTHNQK